MSYPEDLNQDVSFNLNALGPLPRQGIMASPVPTLRASRGIQEDDAHRLQYDSNELPHDEYDFDENLLGRAPAESHCPSEPHISGNNSSSGPNYTSFLATTDTSDVGGGILRLPVDVLGNNDAANNNDRGLPLACESQRPSTRGSALAHQILDKTTKKRRRTSRVNMLTRGGACEFCKRRRSKCSAELPSCSRCLKSGRECVYAQAKQKSRLRIVEDRLVELEEKLAKAQGDRIGGAWAGPA